MANGNGGRVVIGTQEINLDLQESIKLFDGGKSVFEGGAASISDPDLFVGLVQDLLMIFPNADPTSVLDAPISNPNVSADDLLVVEIVVPQLRAMLAATPREKRRRKIRKAQLSLTSAKEQLLAAVERVQSRFGKLVNALR